MNVRRTTEVAVTCVTTYPEVCTAHVRTDMKSLIMDSHVKVPEVVCSLIIFVSLCNKTGHKQIYSSFIGNLTSYTVSSDLQ